jgi:putative PIN family toxin of toxin-antitoxin system
MERSKLDQNLGLEIQRRRLEKGFSQEYLAEITGLHRTYISQLERRFFLTNFLKTVEFIVEKEVIVVCRDPKDDKILNLALSGQAEYIISGDQDLLVLNPFQGIQIITIDTFLKIS